MKKDTFSVIFVPHDLKKTRTYRIQYKLFYTFLSLCAVGAVALVMFIATYGRLLVKARESVMLERQVVELTNRNEKIGQFMRNLAQMRSMNLQVRRMLGIEITEDDSLLIRSTSNGEDRISAGMKDEQEQMLSSIPSFWPVKGFITRGYSIAGSKENAQYHPGIDIGVVRGTPVKASASGYVVESGWDDVYGYYVKIDHGYGMKSLYGHNDRLAVIKGEKVARGQTVAYSGNTGRSTAPHLHFEVTQNNVPVDPLKYLLQ